MTLASLYRQVRRPLQWALALLALLFLARLLADSWRDVQGFTLAFDPAALALSLLALLVTLCLAVLPWQWSVRWLGTPLPFAAAGRIWFLSNAVRYVPGNIWQPATMLVMLRTRGVDELRAAASIALNWLLSNVTALALAGLCWTLAATGPSGLAREHLWLLPLILLLPLLALHPTVLGRALRLIVQRARPGTAVAVWRFEQLLLLTLLHALVWLAYGLAFSLFWGAFAPVSAGDFPRLTAAFAAAYAIGFLSLLTPSGLGVREGALVLLLAGAFPVALVTAMALLSRLWLIAGELLCTAIVLALTRGRHA